MSTTILPYALLLAGGSSTRMGKDKASIRYAGTTQPEIVAELNDILPSSPSQYIMSPYSGLPSKIVITAWRHHLYLDEVDVEEIRRFIDEYKDRAPESVPGNSF